MKGRRYVGKPVPRNDGWAKVTGQGVFTHDMQMPGMLYGKVLRSPHAHAKILSIDTSAAEAFPGVKAVATYKNTSQKPYSTSAGMWFHAHSVRDQRTFDEFVRYVGDEVAAVAATSENIAEEACKLIKVEYELLPAIYDSKDALTEGAPLVHPEYSGPVGAGISPYTGLPQESEDNVVPYSAVSFEQGDFEKGWAEGEVFAEVNAKMPIQKPAQLETHAALAHFKGNGELSVCCTTQNPYPTKMTLAYIFDLPHSKVRVYNPPYIGGGFGCRIGLSGKAEPIAAELSRLSGKPVKLVYTREEDFTCSDTRHSGYVMFKLAAKKDGTIVAVQGRTELNTGAYASYGIDVPAVLAINTLSTYSIYNIDYKGKSIYTNITPAGAMRGFGTPQGTFALEAAVDDIAKQLHMDPVEIRKKNIRPVNDEWFIPYPVTSTTLGECINKVSESIGWKEKRGKKQEGTIRRGVGIGIGAHGSNSFPSVDYSNIVIRLEADGSIFIGMCVPDMGTGTSTTLPQIAAETIGVSFDNVRLAFADTDTGPWDIGSHASRTLYSVGLITVKAGTELKNDILEYAAKNLFQSEPEALDIDDGIVKGAGKEIPLADVAFHAHANNIRFNVTMNNRPGGAPPWVAHAVEVEVDMETGEVSVLKVAAGHDCGMAINPQIVEGQIQGGLAMGLGYGLREEMLHNERGANISGSYHRYMMPTIEDMPEVETFIVECDDPSGPFGAKSVGECGLVPTAAAVASAVEDAIGIRIHEIPLTPQRVLGKINEVYGRK